MCQSGFQPHTQLTLVARDSGDKTNYRDVVWAKGAIGGWRLAVTGGHYHLWKGLLSLESMESWKCRGSCRQADTVRDQGEKQGESSDFSHLPSCDLLPLTSEGEEPLHLENDILFQTDKICFEN